MLLQVLALFNLILLIVLYFVITSLIECVKNKEYCLTKMKGLEHNAHIFECEKYMKPGSEAEFDSLPFHAPERAYISEWENMKYGVNHNTLVYSFYKKFFIIVFGLIIIDTICIILLT